MGNLVTNRINFRCLGGMSGFDSYADVLALITPAPIDDIRGRLAGMSEGARTWEPLDLGLAAPQPDGLGGREAVSWRENVWGTRAHEEEVGLWFEDGHLCVKFDTVNAGPAGWVAKLAAGLPRHGFTGVSYDADNDYSLSFSSDAKGDVRVEESNDPDDVLAARAFVAGLTVEELLDEMSDMGEDGDED